MSTASPYTTQMAALTGMDGWAADAVTWRIPVSVSGPLLGLTTAEEPAFRNRLQSSPVVVDPQLDSA